MNQIDHQRPQYNLGTFIKQIAHTSVCVGGALTIGTVSGLAIFIFSSQMFNVFYEKELQNARNYNFLPPSKEGYLAIAPILNMLAAAGYGLTGIITFGIVGYYATDRLARNIEKQVTIQPPRFKISLCA